MLETTLQKPSSSPTETSLELISFFRNEYPLGGAVETRFIRLFPMLCERLFGPIVLSTNVSENINGNNNNNGNASTASSRDGISNNNTTNTVSNGTIRNPNIGITTTTTAAASTTGTSNDNFETLVQSAWFNKRNQWRIPSSSTSSSSKSGSTTSNMTSRTLESDPVIQLLSPSSIMSSTLTSLSPSKNKTMSITGMNNNNNNNNNNIHISNHTVFLHIIESTNLSRQLKNIRLPFPFMELPKHLQQAFILQLTSSLIMNTTTTTTTTSTSNHSVVDSTPSYITLCNTLWNQFHIPSHDQRELISFIQNWLENQHQQQYSHNRHHNRHHHHHQSPTFHLPMNDSHINNSNINTTPSLQQTNMFISPQPSTTTTSSSSQGNSISTLYYNNIKDAKVMLDAWEYYMILFLRHGATTYSKMKTIIQNQPGNMGRGVYGYNYSSSSSSSQLYGEKVYHHLFKSYCEYYIPHIFDVENSTFIHRNLPSFDNNNKKVFDENQHKPKVFDEEMEMIMIHDKKSDLFIRLVIEFYFDLDHVYSTTKQALNHYSASSTSMKDEMEKNGLLAYSYELATLLPIPMKWNDPLSIGFQGGVSSSNTFIKQNYCPQSKQAQRNTRILIDQIIRDPAIRRSCYRDTRHASGNGGSSSSPTVTGWPLQNAQTLLQPSFYNYIRTALAYGPVHVKNSSFYSAMDAWLTWLEPWNVQSRKTTKVASIENAKDLFSHVSSGRTHTSLNRKIEQRSTVYCKRNSTDPSRYTLAWETYVAANLHLYVVPLAIFLRRARELDFSKDAFHGSLVHVQRVLRVFSPNLVKTLEKLLKSQHSTNIESNFDDQLLTLVRKHENNLGSFSPPRLTSNSKDGNSWSLEMLQQDMHALLEEISLQHRKTIGEQDFFDMIGTKIQGLFLNEGLQAEERKIKALVTQAKLIVNFPQTYEVFPNGKGQNNASNLATGLNDNIYAPEREQSGCITDKGRSQLLDGSKICNAMDVAFVGDPMYARVKNYEVEVLVKISIFISEWLNAYFGLVAPSSRRIHGDEDKVDLANLLQEQNALKGLKYRVNLRFIADKRNWLTMIILFKIISWLW